MRDQSSQKDVSQTMAEFQAMCHQEVHGYICHDYLRVLSDENAGNSHSVGNSIMRSPSPNSVLAVEKCTQHQELPSLPTLPLHVQEHEDQQEEDAILTVQHRTTLVKYGYRFVDFCDCPREVLAIAMNYFDRFLGTPCGWQWLAVGIQPSQRGAFLNLVFMTALYTAMKLHAPSAVTSGTVAALSRGSFSTEQVEYMERIIIKTLEWRLNPPTALQFVRHLMDMVPTELLGDSTRGALFDVARLQLEMAVTDYSFVTTRASTLALCAVNVALQSMCVRTATVAACHDQIEVSILQPKVVEEILEVLASAMDKIHLDWDQESLTAEDVQERLCIGIASFYLHDSVDDILSVNTSPEYHDDKIPQEGKKQPKFHPTVRASYGEAAVA